jgi:predicted glycosyltransferase
MTKINPNHDPGEKKRSKPRILVAPLDWGLGHATRCIPVIYELLSHAEVWLAGEGAQEALLRQEFPDLPFLHLPGYRVRYGASSRTFLLKLLLQSPRLLYAIKMEKKWLKKAVSEHDFDAVIADNRFGLHHPLIPSVFITHQLMVKGPWGKRVAALVQKQNYRFINRFTDCWVPDEAGTSNLAGELSHPQQMPAIPVKYTGILSRLKKTNTPEQKKHLFISLSGPEPQRTLLENIVINDISHYNGTATIVRGLPGHSSLIPSTNDIRFYNHLNAEEYSREMESAELVISRSGYSTVMDLTRLGKQSILIATPGQTEQEYLAAYLSQQGIACCIAQEKFSLGKALETANQFNYRAMPQSSGEKLKTIIKSFVEKLQEKINPPI